MPIIQNKNSIPAAHDGKQEGGFGTLNGLELKACLYHCTCMYAIPLCSLQRLTDKYSTKYEHTNYGFRFTTKVNLGTKYVAV